MTFSPGSTPEGVAINADPVLERVGQPVVRTRPRQNVGVIVLAVLGFIVLSVILVIVILYLFAVLGPTALLYASLLASFPLAIVLLGIRWIDRWEPEPRPVLLFAFLWGAAAAVFIALVFSGLTQAFEARNGIGNSAGAMFFESAIQAPVIEESAKGIGILILLWVMRSHFDGPIDGIVYGATIAIGFAFTENLQYFGLAIIDDKGLGAGVGETFLLRAVLSPFAHVMFTSATGLLLGIAATRTSRFGAIGYFLIGLVPAVLLHAFWNSASYWATNWFVYYLFIQVPLFGLAITGVVLLRRHEQQLTRRRLNEYAAAGWFTPSEVTLLSTAAGRRQGIAWAARNNVKRPYKAFVLDATRLAFTREKLVNGKDRIGASRTEAELLEAIVADRRAIAGKSR